MWFLLSIASAVVYSLRGLLEKKSITRINKYILGFAVRLFALPFFIIPFVLNKDLASPLMHLNLNFWFAVLGVALLCTPIETYFYYSALKDEELTTVIPILSLGPIVTLAMGSIFLRELPNLFGLLGVMFITAGIYSLKIQHAKEGIFEPVKHLSKNKAVQFMFVVMIFQSIGAIFDKIGVSNSNAYIYAFFEYCFFSVSIGVIAIIKAKSHIHQLATHAKIFLFIGAVIASYTLLYLKALESGFVAYVSAIKNSYILFSIILGILFLKEKEGKQKIFAGIIIVLGLALIKIFG